jgi:UTP:GlnB (protein PII) uridylyltransferase
MQHDLFHVYTVDQHILMVLRNVRRFFMAEHAHEYPFCSQLAAGWDKPYILYTRRCSTTSPRAAAATTPTWARAKCGASAAARIDAEDCKLIEFLVREHLAMSRVAQKEDLGDPAVIAAFAKRVGNERYLTALYLLTVADIRGTSPKVWNAWKGKLLEDLYRYTCARWAAARPTRRPRSRRASARRWCSCSCSPCPSRRTRSCGTRWTSATSCATTPATSPGTRATCRATSAAPR